MYSKPASSHLTDIVEEDDQAEGTSRHWQHWHEGVLEGSLGLRLHHCVQGQSCELHNSSTVKKNTQREGAPNIIIMFSVLSSRMFCYIKSKWVQGTVNGLT